MNIPFRSFTDTIRDMSSAITASAGKLIDLSTGSVLRAIIEANASIVLWIQWLILLMLRTTRGATSAAEDLDSWMADFSLARLSARPATGMATFSRLSATLTSRVPAGTVVKTQDGSVSFVVVEDPANSGWNADLGAYLLNIGVLSLRVPIRAATLGQAGNVLPNTIALIASALPGVDLVNNDVATSGGGNPETDEEFRKRFQNFFASRSKATAEAIGYAVSQVQRGLSYVIRENVDAIGRPKIGNILVVVEDGSGALSNTLNKSLATAIEGVRPVGTVIVLQPPQIIWVDTDITLQLIPEGILSAVQANVAAGVRSYINAVPIGGILSVSRIIQLIYQIESNIESISEIRVNGQVGNLQAPATSSFKSRNIYYN